MENWISISKYSKIYNVSISTLRRRIKQDKIDYVKEKGHYKIKDIPLENYNGTAIVVKENNTLLNETLKILTETQKELLTEKTKEIDNLEKKIVKQAEEIIELKMLIQVLEEDKK